MSVSVLILTLNEEVNLSDCLASVSGFDDIVVFDSFSTDRTVEIAKAAGARIFQRQFDNYAAQRNAALNEVEYKYPWVLMIDADERLTDELKEEIKKVIDSVEENVTMFMFRRKDMFCGKWLKRSSGYPTWFGRLVRRGYVTVKREVNEEYQTAGNTTMLSGHLIHYPFNKGIGYWFERHNRYSSIEARELIADREFSFSPKELFSADPLRRRKSLKQLAYRLPGRPILVFIYLYLIRLGFLDGRAGLRYALLRSIYEYMIDVKVRELRDKKQ